MAMTRGGAIAVLCAAVLLIWGCPAEQNTDTVPVDPPSQEIGDATPAPGEAAGHEEAHADDPPDPSTEALSGDLVDGTRVVEVEAHRYEFVPATIVVKRAEPVRLEVTATDVTHGFSVEDLGIDRRLPPNRTQVIEFTPQRAGRYHFHCSVYCGPGHSNMHGTLIVTE